jgi:DHA3 family tetracycline resistance protein-like MFS transporter
MNAYWIYLVYEGTSAFLMTMIFTASMIYQVTLVGLTPLQLVLVGTTLEASAFLFEIPTGVVADVYSRRLSVIIGVFLTGLAFIIEGSFPLFWVIVLAQVIWALGYTFTSGATQAWISDEISEAAAGKAFLRANQVANSTALVGIGAGMLLGSLKINLPIQLGGVGMLLLGCFLAWRMPETGFKPADFTDRGTWEKLRSTFVDGVEMVRRRPALLTILGIGLIYGLYSEGFDRLWTKHILDSFSLPLAEKVQPVVWLGLLRAVSLMAAIGATEIVERKVDTTSQQSIGRSLFWISLLLTAALFSFALAPSLGLAMLFYLLIYVSRNVISPLYTAWVNQRLDSHVRATVISMSSQVDAIGQVAGGPVVGLIGNMISVRAALLASSLILAPVLGLYRLVMSWGDEKDEPLKENLSLDEGG